MEFLPRFEQGDGPKVEYLKVGPGEKVRGIFRGTPHTFKMHWTGNKSELCTGPENCALCRQGDRPRFRFKVNVIVKDKDTGKYVAKVFEQSFRVYDAMRSLHMEMTEQGLGLDKVVVTITRNGSGKDTTYSILPVFGEAGQVTAQTEKALAQVPLHALKKEDEDGEEETATAHAANDVGEDDVPF